MPKRKKQIIHLLILFFILIIIGYLGKNLNINYKEIVESKEHKNLRTSGYWVLDFIHVDGNWTATNSTYDWCSGSGTLLDPYVIENVTIESSSSSGSCIRIENTNEYFIIQNCTLYNAGDMVYVPPDQDAGIKLYDVQNGKIYQNNVSYNNGSGIYLLNTNNTEIVGNIVYNNSGGISIRYSVNITITNNKVSNNTNFGIYLYFSDNNNVSSNRVNNNTIDGVRFYFSYYNSLINNTIFSNGGSGIYFTNLVLNSIVSRNKIYDNGQYGFYFYRSDNNTISNNTIYNNVNYGIFSRRCANNIITNNNISDHQYGIYMYSSIPGAPASNNTITDNSIFNNFRGIYLTQEAHNNNISNNNIFKNGFGIYPYYDKGYNSIMDNTIYNNSNGIYLSHSDYNSISNNVFENHTTSGINFEYADYNTISNNVVSKGNSGFTISRSENNTFVNNEIFDNQYGIRLVSGWATNTKIYSNQIYNNTDYGIVIPFSNVYIWNNTISNHGIDGIIVYNLLGIQNIKIWENIINYNGQGIHIEDGNNHTIILNTLSNNGDGIYLRNTNETIVFGNDILSNTNYGLLIELSEFNNVTENTIDRNTNDGIYMENSNNNTISGNTVNKNKQNGMNLLDSINNTIIGNIIMDNDENGIYLLNSNYTTITGNYLICYKECIVEVDTEGNLIENNEYYINLTSINIAIDGNTQWASIAATEPWCNGSGTLNDPYIITNVYINGQNSGTCILIQNTTAYFRIEDSMIFNSGAGSYDAGIKFINVTNGKIINNNCSLNQGSGIILLYCTNMTIFNNFVENNTNGYGCWLIWSDNNNLTGNTANYNNIGIGLNYSNYNDIIENFLDFNYYGMSVGNSNNNTISGNMAFYNDVGIGLDYSNYNNISGNFLDFNHNGMILDHSNSNTISGNTLNNNSANGICLYYSNFNVISGNIINGNEFYGLYLFSSNNNSISFNTFIFNQYGIVEEENSKGNSYEDNDVQDRPNGEIIPSQPDNLIFIIIGVAGISLGIMGTIVYTQYRRIKRRKRTDWVKLKKKKGLISPEVDEYRNLIFISYATKDSDLFQIPLITEILTSYPEIEDVLYWESDMHDDIYEYMDDNLKLCKIFLLFCSQTSSASEAVKMEWRSALKLDKKIIPIFINQNDIPPLLTTKLGVQLDTSEVYDSIEDIYQMVLKKLEVPSIRQYCDYIIPKKISKDIFDQKIQTMKTKEIYFENDMSLDQIEGELSSILRRNNFYIVETELDPINSELKGIKGFAEGKYDKQEIALIVKVKKVTEGHNLITTIAMSKKEWIAEEILRDINVKSNNLKSTHELLREYSEKIEAVMEKIADLEDFLAKNLGPELEKLREVLNRYNRDEISRSELINSGADLIGKNFLTAFIKRYFSEEMSLQKKE